MTQAGWRLVDDVRDFDAIAGAFLRADPARYTVVLGAVTRYDLVPHTGPCTWAVHEDNDTVTAVAWRTPPHGLGISAMSPAQARELADLLVAARAEGRSGLDDVPAVVGPPPAAPALAHALMAAWTMTIADAVHETLYALNGTDLATPPQPTGRSRMAIAADVDLLTAWNAAFVVEAGMLPANSGRADMARMVANGDRWVWEDPAGVAVSMVGGRPTGAGSGRIGPVFTPPEHRGHGYAAALTAVVTQALFDSGLTSMTLYADDANQTSTGIYRRLGYQAVMPWAEFHLIPASD